MSQPPWVPEFQIDEALAKRLIEGQFPELAPARLEFVGAGWDNLALMVNGGIIFRFPKRQLAINCMQGELASLPFLPPELSLGVPRLRFRGKPALGYPAPFGGYERLAGRTACAPELSADQRATSASALGEFLRQLHSTELDEAAKSAIPNDRIRRADLSYRLPMCLERLEQLAEAGECLEFATLRSEVERLSGAPAWSGEPRLVHGDLYPRHLLVDEESQVSGVIDWGDVHRGDPALDLAIGFTYLPPSAYSDFEEAYGGVDAATRDRARFRGILYGALLLNYGCEVADRSLELLGRRILEQMGQQAAG